jgi:L-idonate 5-dehydrogenase
VKRFRLHGPRLLTLDEVPEPDIGASDVLVAVRHVGLCGSDKHYFADGRCGSYVPQAPFALGHEFSGVVAAIGDQVNGVKPGDRVAVDPLLACGQCPVCRSGHANLCPEKRYMGSAAAWPHVDGGLSATVAVPSSNVYPLPTSVDLAEAALIEPASVAFHAVRRSGSVAGANVLVVGGGAIGQLILRIVRVLGAARAVLADPVAYNREFAMQGGADQAIDPQAEDFMAQSGSQSSCGFDVVLEAAGAESALNMAIMLVRKGGVVVQVGTLPDRVNVPANQIMAKEIDLRGSVQYHKAFPDVMALLAAGRLKINDLITHRFPFAETPAAFAFALDRRDSIKILVDLPRDNMEAASS